MTTVHFSTTTTVRNVAYSFLWAIFAWLFFWMFWLSAVPHTMTATRSNLPVFKYVSRSVAAAGVNPASVPFVMPGRIKMLAHDEQFQTADLMNNYALPPMYLAAVPGGYAGELQAGAQAWAVATSVIPVLNAPQLFEPPVFKITNGITAGWQIDIVDGLDGGRMVIPTNALPQVPVAPRVLNTTAWIETGMRGEITHAFLEGQTGNDTVDRAILKLMYLSYVTGCRSNAGGRVRITLFSNSP